MHHYTLTRLINTAALSPVVFKPNRNSFMLARLRLFPYFLGDSKASEVRHPRGSQLQVSWDVLVCGVGKGGGGGGCNSRN